VRVVVEQLERLLRAVVPIAVYRSRVAADPFQVSLQQPRNIGLVHLERRRRCARLHRLVGSQGRDLLGVFLGGALDLLDLKLGIRDRLTFGLLDLLSRGFRLLLGEFDCST
jgi:hypothetical protein